MANRLFYTIKFSSGLLKEYKYNLNLTFEECLKSGFVVSLSDSQMLKSIRDITGKKIDRELLEEWYTERNSLKNSKNVTKAKKDRIRELQNNIYQMMYIPEYITVVMEDIKEYEHMFKKGFIFNGVRYKRGSCSASQARVSTIVFVDERIKDELKRRLDNGRDMNHLLAPSKYNAYFGLYSSAIKTVRKPRFCVVPDYCENQDVDVDFVVETDKDSDDIIEQRTMSIEFNRFDGSGIISPEFAEKWGEDIGDGYTPCQFCIRTSFTKGMVNVFDFVEWCKEKNDENYIIKDIYGNDRDLREIDVILSEGQVKLWDSWESQESFEKNCEENGIVWGVTKYAPKKDNDVLVTNYQFLQTLNLDDEMIDRLCQDTVDYIQGVSYNNRYYALLFMLGQGMDEEEVQEFLKSSDNYWLKSLMLDEHLFDDKYTKEKIRDFIVTKIEQACLGKINVRGNFQCIVPDNYAYMEWICYRGSKPVQGLLKPKEAYCQYWNNVAGCNDKPSEEVVMKVDAMRSPLTHFSEHGIDSIVNTEEMAKWYKYSYSGYICNVHDEFTMVHAGSDFDFDIIASTNSPEFVEGAFKNQRVVTYTAKKPKKKKFDENDLFVTDTFSFGNSIGQITNLTSTFVGMMANFDKDSKEYKQLSDRVKAGCAAQSRQIDKTKIGENVKTLGSVCNQWQRIDLEKDSEEEIERKRFLNRILAEKKPYFFKYKYKALNKEINDYKKKQNEMCEVKLYETLDRLIEKSECGEVLSEGEKIFLDYYKHFMPVLESPCVMNKICKHIEGIDFSIKAKVRSGSDFDYKTLQSNSFMLNKFTYEGIKSEVEKTFKEWDLAVKAGKSSKVEKIIGNDNNKEKFDRTLACIALKTRLDEICMNEEVLANNLVYLFYVDKPGYSKSVLWSLVGKQLYKNILLRVDSIYFPVRDRNGSLDFLYNKFAIKKIDIDKSRGNENSLDEFTRVFEGNFQG